MDERGSLVAPDYGNERTRTRADGSVDYSNLSYCGIPSKKAVYWTNAATMLIHLGNIVGLFVVIYGLDIAIDYFAEIRHIDSNANTWPVYTFIVTELLRFNALWFLVAFAILSFVSQAYTLVWYKQFWRMVELGYQVNNWLEYTFSASIMIVLIQFMCGCTDFWVHLLTLAHWMVMNLLGLSVDLNRVSLHQYPAAIYPRRPGWQPNWNYTSILLFLYGSVIYVASWASVFHYYFLAIGGSADVPWFVTVVIIALPIEMLIFPVAMFLDHAGYIHKPTAIMLYKLASAITKTTLTWNLAGGLIGRS